MSDNPIVEPADKFYTTDSVEAEPSAPAVQAEVTKQEIQEPEQEVEKLDNPVKVKAETEESESEESEQESQYLDLDGAEVGLDDVRKWRDGHMMQSDYTKKTTTLADERKTFEAERESERENLLQAKSEVSEMRDTLSVLVAEDEEINWVELKEDDPDRYIELKEQADKRKEALAKVKADRETPVDDPALIQAEQGKLFQANPEWLDENNKPTEAYSKDVDLMNDYVNKAGFDPEEFKSITRAHHMMTILKAAKHDQLQEKGREIKEKREKVPVVTRPKATESNTQSKSMADTFYSTG